MSFEGKKGRERQRDGPRERDMETERKGWSWSQSRSERETHTAPHDRHRGHRGWVPEGCGWRWRSREGRRDWGCQRCCRKEGGPCPDASPSAEFP